MTGDNVVVVVVVVAVAVAVALIVIVIVIAIAIAIVLFNSFLLVCAALKQRGASHTAWLAAHPG